MHKIEFTGSDIVLEYPESGLEFNAQQFVDFSGLVANYQSGTVDYHTFCIALTYKLLGLTVSAKIDDDQDSYRISENLNTLSSFADAFFTTSTNVSSDIFKVIAPLHYRQLLPIVRVGLYRFYGPSDALTNTVYGEYCQLLNALHDYHDSGLIKDLDTVIATIYRPRKLGNALRKWSPGYDADPRRAFNPNLTQEYVRTLKRLPYDVKYAIYLYACSCQHFITNSTDLPIGGGATINIASLYTGTGSTTKSIGVLGTLYSLAETKVFGDVDKTAKQNTFDVLAFLVDQKNKIEEIKSYAKNK